MSKTKENKINPEEQIGIAHLPNLKHKVFLSTPNYFNIIIAGSKGTGKSTFIESLNLKTNKKKEEEGKLLYDLYMETSKSYEKLPFYLLEFIENRFKVIENKSILNLKVIEIDSIGDSVNNKEAIIPILSFIDKQNQLYYIRETIDNDEVIEDQRIHVFLYFFNASSPRKIDLEIMEAISKKVNLIPCCSKSDILMEPEIERIEESKIYKQLKGFLPIQFIMNPNRIYSYGQVSDIDTLREKLIKKYILELKNKTEIFYETFKQKLIIKNLLKEESIDENDDVKFLRDNLEKI